jgi:hypothetical protein
MIVKPDDQVLDYFIYQGKINRAIKDVERFQNGYQFWMTRKRVGE